MRIGLISDTHIPNVLPELPEQIAGAFRGVDLILHAGDIYELSVLDALEHTAPVLAALGDDDAWDMTKDKRVARKHVLQLEGHTLWLIHEKPYSVMASPAYRQMDDCPDIVVFGHEHSAIVRHYGEVLFVSPGSATFPGYRHELGTVGILDLNSSRPETRIIQLV